MTGFVALCALAFVAALLAVTGGGHLVGLPGFARLLRRHDLVPAALVAPAALTVTAAELALAAAAAAALAAGDPRLAALAFAAALAVGAGFLAYLGRLLRSGHTGSCGCSPLATPLTPASFAPAAGLAIAGALGLAAGGAGGGFAILPAAPAGSAWSALPAAWGVALVVLVLLLPATAPARAGEVAS